MGHLYTRLTAAVEELGKEYPQAGVFEITVSPLVFNDILLEFATRTISVTPGMGAITLHTASGPAQVRVVAGHPNHQALLVGHSHNGGFIPGARRTVDVGPAPRWKCSFCGCAMDDRYHGRGGRELWQCRANCEYLACDDCEERHHVYHENLDEALATPVAPDDVKHLSPSAYAAYMRKKRGEVPDPVIPTPHTWAEGEPPPGRHPVVTSTPPGFMSSASYRAMVTGSLKEPEDIE